MHRLEAAEALADRKGKSGRQSALSKQMQAFLDVNAETYREIPRSTIHPPVQTAPDVSSAKDVRVSNVNGAPKLSIPEARALAETQKKNMEDAKSRRLHDIGLTSEQDQSSEQERGRRIASDGHGDA